MKDEHMRIDTFVNRLNKAMSDRNMNQADLVQRTGIRKQQISQYVNGLFEAKQQAVYRLSQALNVSEAWLMGYDVPMEKPIHENFDLKCNPEQLACEVALIEKIQKVYGKDAVHLLKSFMELNEVGKEKALENITDLTAIPKYTEDDVMYRAARSDDHAKPKTMKKDKDKISRLEKALKVTDSDEL